MTSHFKVGLITIIGWRQKNPPILIVEFFAVDEQAPVSGKSLHAAVVRGGATCGCARILMPRRSSHSRCLAAGVSTGAGEPTRGGRSAPGWWAAC